MKKLLVIVLLFVAVSVNGQTGWFQQNSGTTQSFASVYFLNDQTGFAGGGFRIFKTTNGGTSWIEKILPDTTTLTAIRFLNSTTGYACGGRPINNYYSYQHLFKTTNAGETWVRIIQSSASFSTQYFYDVYPIDSLLYLTQGGTGDIGVAGAMLVSTNGGVNFNSLDIVYGEKIMKTSFINPQTGWVSTLWGTDVPYSKRKVFKTTNSGQNWTMQYRDSSTNNPLSNTNFELQFVNQNTGYGLYYKVYSNDIVKFIKTTNSGVSWDSTTLQYNKSKALFFADGTTGWIGGGFYPDSIMIIRTTNGGTNWQIQKKGDNTISSIFFVNNLTGWAVGYGGVILKTVTGGVTSVQNISTEVPSAYSLGQNYPNPFNSTSNLKFEIAKLGNVKITVYDVQGREVETLVNEQLQPGTYSTQWNASAYSSGVYFYKIQVRHGGSSTGEFSETKRMTLIK